MKSFLATIFTCVFALTGTTALANVEQRPGTTPTFAITERLGLLLCTPRAIVDKAFSRLTDLV